MIINTMKRKHLILLVSLVLIFTLAVGGTLAYIATHTSEVINTFTPAKTEVNIDEDFQDETVKSNVKVENTGNIPAYVRAKIVITWKDKDGNVLAQKPADADYTMEFPSPSNWVQHSDGYYYYTKVLNPEDKTTNLIDRCVAHTKNGEYDLSVEILAQSVQAEPADVIEKTWKVSINDVTSDSGN